MQLENKLLLTTYVTFCTVPEKKYSWLWLKNYRFACILLEILFLKPRQRRAMEQLISNEGFCEARVLFGGVN